MTLARQAVFYITHGGGPCFWTDLPHPFGAGAFDKLRAYLTGMLECLPQKPKALVIISAHWETDEITVSTALAPGMLFDYTGFPEHTYRLNYAAPGAPDIAQKVMSCLDKVDIRYKTDDQRGYDHGVFVPMLIIDAKQQIPVVMLSLQNKLDATYHLALGQALQPLRDENILIMGSGSSYHNLREWFQSGSDNGVYFDKWLTNTITNSDINTRNQKLMTWQETPNARSSHPREEHLLPLMVAVGAAGNDQGVCTFHDSIGGKPLSCFAFGAITA